MTFVLQKIKNTADWGATKIFKYLLLSRTKSVLPKSCLMDSADLLGVRRYDLLPVEIQRSNQFSNTKLAF